MRRPGELQNGAAAAPIKGGLAAGVPEHRERAVERNASAVKIGLHGASKKQTEWRHRKTESSGIDKHSRHVPQPGKVLLLCGCFLIL